MTITSLHGSQKAAVRTQGRTKKRSSQKGMLSDGLTRLNRSHIDVPFLVLTLLLLCIGLVTLFSVSFPYARYKESDPFYFLKRQGLFSVIGVFAMLAISRFSPSFFRRWANVALAVAGILLFLVLIPGIGVVHNNARRWIGVSAFEFQPSEVAKFAVILFFSDRLARRKRPMEQGQRGLLQFASYLGILLIAAGLMMGEPHLSGTVLIMVTGFTLLIISGIPWSWVGVIFAGGIAAGYLLVGVLGYGASRISMWLDPWQDMQDKGYQMCQSLITIGSGGPLGLGPFQSIQKYMYLPEQQNDFIFSVYCEEVGFVGAVALILLFTALIVRGYWIAFHARDRFGFYLTCGIMTLFTLQVFLNIAVVTGLVPCTGISLPFFSYGGTALCMQLAEMGIVLSVSRQIRPPRAE